MFCFDIFLFSSKVVMADPDSGPGGDKFDAAAVAERLVEVLWDEDSDEVSEEVKRALDGLSKAQVLEVLQQGDDDEQKVPLYYAIVYRHARATEMMLEKLDEEDISKFMQHVPDIDDKETLLLHHVASSVNANNLSGIDVMEAILGGLSQKQAFELMQKGNGRGETPLHILARKDAAEAINIMLKKFSQEQFSKLMEQKDTHEATPLFYAVINESVEALEVMLKNISQKQLFELMQPEGDMKNILYHAASRGKVEAIETVLNRLSQDQVFKLAQQEGSKREEMTPLYLLASHREVDVIKSILGRLNQEQIFKLLHQEGKHMRTPLYSIVSDLEVDDIKNILGRLKPEQLFELVQEKNKDWGKMVPLHSFISHRKVDAIETIFEGLSQDQVFKLAQQKNKQGVNLLHALISDGRGDVVEKTMLGRLSQDQLFELVHQRDGYRSSLFNPFVPLKIDDIRNILGRLKPEQILSVLKQTDEMGQTLLDHAILREHVDIEHLLSDMRDKATEAAVVSSVEVTVAPGVSERMLDGAEAEKSTQEKPEVSSDINVDLSTAQQTLEAGPEASVDGPGI